MSDEEVGEIIGVSRVMAWKYRTGRASPRLGVYDGVDIHDRCVVALRLLTALVDAKKLPKPHLELGRSPDAELIACRNAMLEKLRRHIDRLVVEASTNK